jgi:sulfotransferase
MDNGIHFISGLPRSGSTLFAAILNQNPRFHAGMSSPVGSLAIALQRNMSSENDMSVFIDNEQRTNIIRSVFPAYYQAVHPSKVVFDTNRIWCSKMPLITHLYPNAKIIACVRHIPWIVDSIERLVRANKLEPSKMFGCEVGGTVYNRFDTLASSNGMVGFAYHALREAFYSDESDRLLLLSYESLTKNPKQALTEVYKFIDQPAFEHDFDDVTYDADEFDFRLGSPGLHRVSGPVRETKRATILPPDLFRRMEPDSFWLDKKTNLRNVRIV